DVARMVMYMYVRYGNRCLPKNVGIGDAVATDSNMIDLFLQWNAEDPVSPYEDNRNTYLGNASNAYGQGNRNPFIDNPYLATMIWGGTPAENRWPALANTAFSELTSSIIYPNPATHNMINIHSEAILDSIEFFNINGQKVMQLVNPVSQNNIYVIDYLPTGFYLVKLSSDKETT